jgi:hypothetical protein
MYLIDNICNAINYLIKHSLLFASQTLFMYTPTTQ